MDHRGEEPAAAAPTAHRLEGMRGALGSDAQGQLSVLLWVAKALEIVVLEHGLVLGEASWLGEVVAAELGPSEGVNGWVGPVLHPALVRVQSMVQVDGLVAPEEGRGLPVPVHCQDGNRVPVGVHAGSCGVSGDLAGSVHSARVMDGQDHALLVLTAAHLIGKVVAHLAGGTLLLLCAER